MLTRGLIQSADEAETEYQKVVGSEFGVKPPKKNFPGKPKTLQEAEAILAKSGEKKSNKGLESPTFAPITPVTLPPAPPAPFFSEAPTSITEADLETYIKPLVTNGWTIGGPRTSAFIQYKFLHALQGHPALRRVYTFHEYTSARHFLHTVVANIPAPVRDSLVRSRHL